ncbi:MAG TPA: LamG-like jellyroll fold domain-containing protein [Verrucomicrobiae bacterium]|nr:LamG-like jellyroll fold domain-containing protein [Verrucomicrobiae bacterium]
MPRLFYDKNFTIEFWFNASGPGVLLSENEHDSYSDYWNVAIAEALSDGTIVVGLRHSNSPPIFDIPAFQAGKISFGSWNHLAIRYDESNQTLSAYLNTVFGGSSKGARELPAHGADYAIGRGGPKDLGPGAWLIGEIDEVRFWRTVRSEVQIAAYWKRIFTTDSFRDPPFGPPPGLAEHWHLDMYFGNRSPGINWPGSAAIHFPGDIRLVPSTAPISKPPIIITRQVEHLSANSVRLSATVMPQYSGLRVYFEWGPTTQFGTMTNATYIKEFQPDAGGDFSVILTNLSGGLYHSRVHAAALTNGPLVFSDPANKAFTIDGTTAETRSAIMSGNAPYMRGASNPHGVETSVFFEWGLSREYGNTTPANSIGAGNTDVHCTASLPPLPPGVYHFRTVALFPGGRANGNDMTFLVFAPTVITTPAIVGADNVMLYGAANPHGLPANVYFEWGTSTAYGNKTPPQRMSAITADVVITNALFGLSPGIYHYRAILTNDNEQVVGGDQTFTSAGGGSAVQLFQNGYIRPARASTSSQQDNDFTIEFFFKAFAPGILINEVDTQDVRHWDYALAEIFPDGSIKAAVPGVPVFNVAKIPFNEWRHLALVYDSVQMRLSAYVDGKASGSSDGTRFAPWQNGRPAFFCIGRGGQTNLGGGRWIGGLFDEVRIWRRAIPPAEVAEKYNRLAGANDPWLDAYWQFDVIQPGPWDYSPDSSPNNNTGWYVSYYAMPDRMMISDAPIVVDRRPIIASVDAITISPIEVQIQGKVHANGADTTVYFEFGRSNVLNRTVARSIGSSLASVLTSEVIQNLEPGRYEYRLVASNSFGVSKSESHRFGGSVGAGYAYYLTGGGYLRTTEDQKRFFPDSSLTVELWFNPTKGGVLLSELDATQGYNIPLIEMLPSGDIRARFNGIEAIDLGHAKLDTWHHVALRYDSSTRKMTGFLNGRKTATQVGSRLSATGMNESSSHFAFGRGSNLALGTGENFAGAIDEVRIWNIARTDEDLSIARNNLVAGDEPGLVLNWRGNVNEAGLVVDTSPNNNHGKNVAAEVIVSTAPLVFNIRPSTAANVELQFLVKGGTNYRIEQTSDFISWLAISTNVAPQSGLVRLSRTVNPNHQMSIFRALPQ